MGKPKYIETPEKLWELFEKYREQIKSNPRYKYEIAQKIGEPIRVPLEVPLTIEGFREFGHQNGVTLNHYFANTDGAYEDYRTICSRVTEAIRNDQIQGGMVGQYNPSITQRLNGLTEKQENTVTANVIHTTLDLGNEIPNPDTPTP